jgi:hypothetical protein
MNDRDKIAEIIEILWKVYEDGMAASIGGEEDNYDGNYKEMALAEILALFPDLSAYEVEVECLECKGWGTYYIKNKYTICKQCSNGTIRIPLTQFISEGRSEGKVVKVR